MQDSTRLYGTTCGGDYEKVIEEANILTEIRKHIDSVQPFGDNLANAMRGNDKKVFDKAETLLTEFMSETGARVSEIDSISSWVQLMSCTGILHGSTYTRLIAVPEIHLWRSIDQEKYDDLDTSLISGASGTIAGMMLDRHVFTSEMTGGEALGETEVITDDMMSVLQKYNQMSLDLKETYKADILEREDF